MKARADLASLAARELEIKAATDVLRDAADPRVYRTPSEIAIDTELRIRAAINKHEANSIGFVGKLHRNRRPANSLAILGQRHEMNSYADFAHLYDEDAA